LLWLGFGLGRTKVALLKLPIAISARLEPVRLLYYMGMEVRLTIGG